MTEVLTTAELRSRGIGPKAIRRQLAAGTLHRVDHGLFLTEKPRGRLLLQALQKGRPELVFTGRTAWELRRKKSYISVPAQALVPRNASARSTEFVQVTRVTRLQWEVVEGLRLATALRTALDMPEKDEYWAVNFLENHYRGRPGRRHLDRDLARFGRVPARLRQLVDQAAVGGDSQTERTLFRELRKRGMVMEQNKAVGHYFRDGVHEGRKVVVEVNGLAHHRSEQALVKDYWKANDAQARGYVHLAYSDVCVDRHLRTVVEEIEGVMRGRRKAVEPVWEWHCVWEEENLGIPGETRTLGT